MNKAAIRSVTLGWIAASIIANLGCTKPAGTIRDLDAEAQATWVSQTLAVMSLREKIGQMFFYYLDTNFKPESAPDWQRVKDLVERHQVGGLHLWNGQPHATAFITNRLQQLSTLPLLFTADLEHGVARFGGTDFPPNMALAATGDPHFAYLMGFHTAREARSLGISLNFAPVADVNNNPANPIINIRSFGEDPETVAQFVETFIRGSHDGGVLATAKHFPGHGDTGQDSHIELAYIEADSSRLESIELFPFRRAIAVGVDLIMTAHINIRGLQSNPYEPATLSHSIMTDVLRDRLQFDGLLITDAMQMWSVSHNYTDRYSTVAAIKAGADIVLAQDNIPPLIDEVERRVQSGEISPLQIDRSVRRILAAKAKLNLQRNRYLSLDSLSTRLAHPDALNAAHETASRAITLLKNESHVLPLASSDSTRIVVVNLWDAPDPPRTTAFERELEPALPGSIQFFDLHPESSEEEYQRIFLAARAAAFQIVPAYTRIGAWKGKITLPEVMQPRVNELLSASPSIVVSFGNPYLYPQVHQAAAYVVAYDDGPQLSAAAARALMGVERISGRLPISIPGYFAIGAGLVVEPKPMAATNAPMFSAPALRYGFPEETGMSSARLDSVKALVQQAVQDSVFPGAVLLAGRNGIIALHQSFGALGYGTFCKPMPLDGIFDLASLTKVVAATTACMILYERGLLHPQDIVQKYLPQFTGKDKEKITIAHLLTHSSGLPAYKRYFSQQKNADEIIGAIMVEELEYAPGTNTIYSDLGVILLGKIIERVSGKPLDRFCREEIFLPLGMRETLFNPPESFFKRIAPTELDSWRGRMVHGVVHDENAFALNGVSAHAGLFAPARDLAILLQMLLNGGSYGEVRLLKPETIAYFTSRKNMVAGSSRALGWDTADGKNSAGRLMSQRAFGHTGFTGTSLWADPESGLFVVLLSNRVHPTRENKRILEFRPKLHDAIVNAMTGGFPQTLAQ